MRKNDLGIIGLGVMGRNLALNTVDHGFRVAVYNRTASKMRDLVSESPSRDLEGFEDLAGLVASLDRPRRVLVMVQAGSGTDAVLEELLPQLEAGDLVMDGGNAHFHDTERRTEASAERGIRFLGVGISGGESGARRGPSLMVGGEPDAYRDVSTILERIAAEGPRGACCARLGAGSAGHYVKMVHNGIEYAIMQGIAEAYDLLRCGLGLNPVEIADTIAAWRRREIDGYLTEITEQILRTTEGDSDTPRVDRILDEATQKGTGKWSTQSALDMGTPAPTIAASVFARIASALKRERLAAESLLAGAERTGSPLRLEDLYGALLLATISSYAQGFRQLGDASGEREYALDLAEVVRVWMDGCIIRSDLLEPMYTALKRRPSLPLLFLEDPFRTYWDDHQGGFRRTVAWAHLNGVPVPAFGASLSFLDAYRSSRLPAHLIQAQRDAFGAHTYRRTDREGAYHTDWDGDGAERLIET